MKSFSERTIPWIEAMKARGHVPKMTDDYSDDGTMVLNMFYCSSEFHNGPGCEACHMSWCEHCSRPEDVGECTSPALELTAARIAGALT